MQTPLYFETPSQFSLYIEQLALAKKMTLLETILEYCEENYIDPEDLKTMINKTLKDKLEKDLQNLGMLPKHTNLDELFNGN